MDRVNIISILDDENDALIQGAPALAVQVNDELPFPVRENLMQFISYENEICELRQNQDQGSALRIEVTERVQIRAIKGFTPAESEVARLILYGEPMEINSIMLINGSGGYRAIANTYVHANQYVSRRGKMLSGNGKTYTFATNNALSASAHLLMTGDKRGVLEDTQILFHIGYKCDFDDDRPLHEMEPHWQTPDQIAGDIQEMVANILNQTAPEKRGTLEKEILRQLQGEENQMPTLENGCINRNTFDPRVIFSGAEAHTFGLVDNVYGGVEKMKIQLMQLFGERFGQQIVTTGPVAEFFENEFRF